MPSVDPTTWRTSSYSGGDGNNGDCVEVALAGSAVAIRDSKDRDSGRLRLSAAAWHAFLTGLYPSAVTTRA
ncbi:DUF397 domain-containing protein [Haloechinothrix sp. YIM 98757]|uniref:DUF397 domain-containing protein n=1 Tax=Haloechinothrix aidingensis TaxID=2752311 RepID=A0A837ZYG3_9PSEU|nr:DUF397 domain-containing protein [Haloechinothrix aidingensis]MBA0125676.1 DUF397 domain-containing protein [Haloechinothrix aidingensis]